MNESKREAVAYHEAGHATAAWHFKIQLKSATIIPSIGYTGRVHHADPLRGIRLDIDNSDRARVRPQANHHGLGRASRAAATLAALVAALSRKLRPRDSARPRPSTGGRRRDREIATAYLRYLDLRAKALIAVRWWAVELIAAALLDRGTITGAEIGDMIAEHVMLRVRLPKNITVEPA